MEFVNQMRNLQPNPISPSSMSNATSNRCKRPTGFTLIELLAVIIIVSLLIVASAPAVLSSIESSRLTSSGEGLMADLSLAQQTSLSLGQTTEVRFYKFAPDDGFGDSASYAAYQIFRIYDQPTEDPKNPGGALVTELPITEPKRFREGVLLAPTESPLVTREPEQPEGGRYFLETGATYAAFRFTSEGTTNISIPMRESYVTLAAFPGGVASPTLPKNIYTIQINPATGNLRSYRP